MTGEVAARSEGADRESSRGLALAVVVYALILIAKTGAWLASGLLALLAEALHTLADLVISAFLLLAARWSRRAPDAEHSFGHGRAQNVAALVAATLFISFTSLRLVEEAVPKLLRPHPGEHGNIEVAIVVLAGSMLVAGVPLLQLLRERRRGAAAKAQLVELVNDQLGLVAALVGTVLVLDGVWWADPVAALVVAAIIAVNAVALFRENSDLLLGRTPGNEVVARLGAVIRSAPGVITLHGLRAEWVGPGAIHADVHIEVEPRLTVVEGNAIAREVRRRVEGETECRFLTVHLDPAGVLAAPPAAAPPT